MVPHAAKASIHSPPDVERRCLVAEAGSSICACSWRLTAPMARNSRRSRSSSVVIDFLLVVELEVEGSSAHDRTDRCIDRSLRGTPKLVATLGEIL